MPIGRSSKKSLRKSIKNKKVNSTFKSKVKAVIKAFLSKPENSGFKKLQSVLDKAQQKHLYQKNKVARLKAKYAKSLGKEVEKVAKKKILKNAANKKIVKRKK